MQFNQQTYCQTCEQQDRMVIPPNRIIWSICEDDILAVARDKGIQLTERQLDDVARYVEGGLSAVCNWFMLVEMALNEAVRPGCPKATETQKAMASK